MSAEKKIGIITYYYKTTNYGGILQAYALCKYLNDMGAYAEQISYDYDTNIIKKDVLHKLKNIVKKILQTIIQNKTEKIKIVNKKKAFKKFDESFIRSSKNIYTYESLKINDPGDDVYICGSDQIWNPISMDENFFLMFVPKNKKKYAYAASIGADIISEENNKKYKEMLDDYNLISVRENSAKIFLEKIGVKAEIVPDPVFLLGQESWITFINHLNIRKDKYILTYFLGNSYALKGFAASLSYKYNIHIVDISPFCCFENLMNVVDKSDAGPIEFLNYIYHAEYVLTNSFHCTAFSLIFHKKFLVEQKEQKMNITANDRIATVLSYFNLINRFINSDTKYNMESIINEEYQCDIRNYSKIGKNFIKKILDE